MAGLRSFAKHVERFLAQTNQGATAPSNVRPTPVLEQTSVPLGHVPGASVSSSSNRPPSHLPTSRVETIFSAVRSNVRSGAIRIDITNSEEWSAGDIAVIRNQEAKRVRDIGSLIFETPIQHDYEAGVEVRSLLSTEQLEEIDDRLAVTGVLSLGLDMCDSGLMRFP